MSRSAFSNLYKYLKRTSILLTYYPYIHGADLIIFIEQSTNSITAVSLL
jgi:hypothetical protein